MPAAVETSAGSPVRRRQLWAFVASTAVVAGVIVVRAIVTSSDGDLGLAIAGAVALGLVAASLLVAALTPDSNQFGAEELVIAALLVMDPETFPLVLVGAPVTFLLARRYLGVLSRLRHTSTVKQLFNASGIVIACAVAYAVATAMGGAGAPRLIAAIVGTLAYTAATHVLVFAVMHVASGDRGALARRARALVTASRSSVPLAIVGALVGQVAVESYPIPVLLGVAVVSYAFSRRLTHRFAESEADRHLLAAGRWLSDPETDLDHLITRTAAAVLLADVEIREAPSGPPALSVPLLSADGGADEYVVATRANAVHLRFEPEEEHALRRLVALSGPARQHRHLVSALRRSEESRSAITGALAHDLRGLLSVVIAGASTLQDFTSSLSSEQRVVVTRNVLSGGRRAVAILDDLLELERQSLDPVTDDPGDVGEVVERLAGWHGQQLNVEPGPATLVALDRRLLERALDNLVGNALKFAPDSMVTIRWRIEESSVLIAVEDDGPGIPEAIRSDVAGAFRQRDPGVEGVGLGLYLARRFADLAGGSLEVCGRQGGGASMQMSLPRRGGSVTDDPTTDQLGAEP